MPTGPKKVLSVSPILGSKVLKKPKPEKTGYTTFRDAFPRTDGPPFIGNNEGGAALAESPEMITVTLDKGAFRAVWEMTEARASQQWETRNVLPSAAAYIRAVKALREAWHRGAAETPESVPGDGSQEPGA